MKKKSIAFVYLGHSGGGALLSQQFATLFRGSDYRFIISSSNEEVAHLRSFSNVSQFNIPPGWGIFWRPTLVLRELVKIIRLLRLGEFDRCVFIMPHPLDLIVSRRIQKNGIKSLHLIHDYPPHPREIFPSAFFLKLLLKKADGILALSTFCAENLKVFDKKIAKLEFPPYELSSLIIREESEVSTLRRILIIGRDSYYKNVKGGLAAIQLSKFNGQVTLAGEVGLTDIGKMDLIVDPRWLSREALEKHIAETDVLLLPYSSATQSGLIPIAIFHRKIIIVTKVGGLPEQIQSYDRGYIAESPDAIDISKAIDDALSDGLNNPRPLLKTDFLDWKESTEKKIRSFN